MLSFVRAIENNGPAPVPTNQIIKNQDIIDGIQRSAACGKEVEIIIPEVWLKMAEKFLKNFFEFLKNLLTNKNK